MPTQPFVLTIFGASGDLAKLRLFPALYQLAVQKRLPKKYLIIGFARTPKTRAEFQKEFAESVRKKEGKYISADVLAQLLDHVDYFSGQYDSAANFNAFRLFINERASKHIQTHLAYFSVPPSLYGSIAEQLADIRQTDKEDLRLIIEKPFGESLVSAESLYHRVVQFFPEEKIYLLDHYLGKQSVQSIFEMRRVNRLLNLMIRGSEVANIQITAFEDVGIGDRVGYFENTGIIKDMIQSHLLQTLALITMSIPVTMEADSTHRERHNILSAIQPPKHAHDIVLGQYESYKKEKGIPSHSKTETFVGLRLFIDREDWHEVPIYLRTGKRIHEKHTYVTIELKKFEWQDATQEPNRLIVEIQPQPQFHIKLLNRLAEVDKYQEVSTSDSIACDIEGCLPDHAALIFDAIRGYKTNFLSFPEILATWTVTDAIIKKIETEKIHLHSYADGSRGPEAQHTLTEKDGFKWYDLH